MKKLQDYQERFFNILESITDGFFSVNENWIVTYWNKEAECIWSISRGLAMDKNV